MKWASAVSERADLAAAVAEAAALLERQLDGDAPDLLLAFVSPHHAAAYESLPAVVAASFARAHLMGCSARGVIGAGHEVEERAALSLTAAVLPGVQLRPLELDGDGLPAPDDAAGWQKVVGVSPGEDPCFVLLCDPFSVDADLIIAGLDSAYPAGRKVGGLASGGAPPSANVLYSGARARGDGAVGVALYGDVMLDTIVAQGCRPIGAPMPVTRVEGNIIRELNRKRPVDVLRALHDSLDARDRHLFRDSLFVGIEMNQGEVEFQAGEFLVRNLAGVDPQSGALAVAADVQPWQVVQFLLRDARTAEHDLKTQLDRYRATASRPQGALLFSCLGRGKHLFGRVDHDTDLFRDKVGTIPLGGFFCNGEIGPVGGQTFLHGYTSAFGLFRHK
jgi:small ligand-binding sensory domain FIST